MWAIRSPLGESAELVEPLRRPSRRGYLRCLDLSPDGRHLVTLTLDAKREFHAELWDVAETP